MKAFKAKYEHGHFIDVETQKRIIPVQEAIFHIMAEDSAFTTEDLHLKVDSVLNSSDKATWAQKKYRPGSYGKILAAGALLFFRVGNSKMAKGDTSRQFIFLCKLLEDLYLFKIKGKDAKEPANWRLADCVCKLEKCLKGGLVLSEQVPAGSLNELFGSTVQFYFSLQRSGAANVFDTYYLYDPKLNINFEDAMWQRYRGLKDLRLEFVKEKK
jgi:hypothetical protein